mmetsp:Transcript_29018/g.42804  ORF Transcript_29018/g.42804 Transcript_29018/m.42804 type:complete len:1236 (+) Transcript_29018:347-4054(+)|eukprot:CAMPEP_0194215340 /NCGR_PEP_ID=MMETSP0156-20130528/17096_1 /TAXON_ID=33649 /ORGANISM="Thalassionema nitzschioides, Strain L26-B" /LENGTH=1235 /DNA_ID=CAMNT_0038943837 /DNA_START=289 /DNA_END=3996 /DNA_ORIENTATION=-
MSTEKDVDWFHDHDTSLSCPCRRPFRFLEEELNTEEENQPVLLWEVLYTCGVLVFMFGALISDRIGADSVMMVSLTALMTAKIISVDEGLEGFANQGLMTVMTLFVVAEGISRTGALDWYMGKLLGKPKTAAMAQIKLMVPISIVSAFMNNTPVVAIMIPIVQTWAKNIRISVQQLLIPLSFASILGGTCTLIGTSTNLVVAELLIQRYPDDPDAEMGIFDIGVYGVPVAMAGICYILIASPCLLPGGSRKKAGDGTAPLDSQEDVLLGARLAPWSPAAGRSVKRSGLRDTGGIYLVSVHRAATGNVHRAVGQDFVLNVGDILYFTGLVESFGEFCEENALEILTNDLQEEKRNQDDAKEQEDDKVEFGGTVQKRFFSSNIIKEHSAFPPENEQLQPVVEGEEMEEVPIEVGVTMQSLIQADEAERSRSITRMIDLVRGVERDEHLSKSACSPRGQTDFVGAHKVVVTSEHELVVVGVNARDRPGLLLDISKGLLRLNLSLRHTEAAVVQQRSISIWRCELIDSEIPDLEQIWSVLNALMESDDNQAIKQRGLRVIRAVVTKTSSMIGKTVAEVDFRKNFKAAIVAVQKGGRNVDVTSVVFGSGDVIVLQVNEDSPLLTVPPQDFYKRLTEANKDLGTNSRSSSVSSFVNMVAKKFSQTSLDSLDKLNKANNKIQNTEDLEAQRQDGDNLRKENESDDDGMFYIDDDLSDGNDSNQSKGEVVITDMQESMNAIIDNENVWKDLRVFFAADDKEEGEKMHNREFLTAMAVAPKSQLAGRTVAEIGLDKLSGVFLVTIDRPNKIAEDEGEKSQVRVNIARPGGEIEEQLSQDEPIDSMRTIEATAISTETPLVEGDVLWFAGSASSVGDLRKIPGLVSYESEEVEKLNEKIHDRRLVEAVVARRGPLVGKTVKEIGFRSKYGAAVIAVHREGKRVHDHPGKVKLQGGDVLLLEAGPTFIRKNVGNDMNFALLAEVKDSAPPRLQKLIPALCITVTMLAVYTAGVDVSLFVCALIASILMVALGILSEQEARDALKWDVYITIAAAFGVGTALVNSGVAGGLANFLVSVGEAISEQAWGLLGAVYLATFLISSVVTNNAAAAMMFPIALDAAEQTGVDSVLMSYCLMLAASASFMSPFGYTTNLMIYGPGGYKYKDFLIIGTPMQIVLWFLSILILTTMNTSNWWIYWLSTFFLLLLVVLTRMYSWSSLARGEMMRCNNKKEEASKDSNANGEVFTDA